MIHRVDMTDNAVKMSTQRRNKRRALELKTFCSPALIIMI